MNNEATYVVDLINEQASLNLANRLAACLPSPPLLLTFSGELGAGKTTLIRAMLGSLGVQSPIKSPSFSLVESYAWQGGIIHHFDLYRIHYEEELEYLGFRDYFSKHSLCCIEWPEHAGGFLPATDICFTLLAKGAGREMHINALSEPGKKIIDCLIGAS